MPIKDTRLILLGTKISIMISPVYLLSYLLTFLGFLTGISTAIVVDKDLLGAFTLQYTTPLGLGDDAAGFAILNGRIVDESNISYLQVDDTRLPLEGDIGIRNREEFASWLASQNNYNQTIPYYGITSLYINNDGDTGNYDIEALRDSLRLETLSPQLTYIPFDRKH